MLTYFEWLLAMLLAAQATWVTLRHWTKFRGYKKLWDLEQAQFWEASLKFDEAQKRQDAMAMARYHSTCQQACDTQRHIMRAQAAVMDDNFIAPWRWPERWNADYLKETAAGE